MSDILTDFGGGPRFGRQTFIRIRLDNPDTAIEINVIRGWKNSQGSQESLIMVVFYCITISYFEGAGCAVIMGGINGLRMDKHIFDSGGDSAKVFEIIMIYIHVKTVQNLNI